MGCSQFRERRIEYRVSDQAKSDIYKELLPLLNSGKIALVRTCDVRMACQASL